MRNSQGVDDLFPRVFTKREPTPQVLPRSPGTIGGAGHVRYGKTTGAAANMAHTPGEQLRIPALCLMQGGSRRGAGTPEGLGLLVSYRRPRLPARHARLPLIPTGQARQRLTADAGTRKFRVRPRPLTRDSAFLMGTTTGETGVTGFARGGPRDEARLKIPKRGGEVVLVDGTIIPTQRDERSTAQTVAWDQHEHPDCLSGQPR